MGEATVAALMREQGLAARRKKKRKGTTRGRNREWARLASLCEGDLPRPQ